MDFSVSDDHRAIREGVNAVMRRFDAEDWLAIAEKVLELPNAY